MSKQDLAMQVLQQVVKLPVVKVDRSKFLVDKYSSITRRGTNSLVIPGYFR